MYISVYIIYNKLIIFKHLLCYAIYSAIYSISTMFGVYWKKKLEVASSSYGCRIYYCL